MAWFNGKQKEIPVWVTSEKYDDLILNHMNYYRNTIKREKTNLVSVQQLNGQQLVQMRKWCFENESYISNLIDVSYSYHSNYFLQFTEITNIIDDVQDCRDDIEHLEYIYISKTKKREKLEEYYNKLLELKEKLQAFDGIEVDTIYNEIMSLDMSFEDKRKEGCLYLLHSYKFGDFKKRLSYFQYSYEEDKEMLEDLICYCEEQLNK